MRKEVAFKNRDRFIQLGIAIASLRKLRGMSQETLAEKANISRSLLRQYRTKIVCELRRQISRQIVSKRRRNTGVFQGVLVQDDEKDASKACAKPLGGLCAVLP